MAKKYISWKTKGMNRDMSVSAFNPEFAFENVNIRLATNEGNTMMSWVNEKGTKRMTLRIDTEPWLEEGQDEDARYEYSIKGTPIGTAVLNHRLVVFTTHQQVIDRIYVLEKSSDGNYDLIGKCLYFGSMGLDESHPIETLVSYESEDIQKVYWTDNKNQPRVINIAPSRDLSSEHYDEHSFDFVPELELEEEVTVTKIFGAGEFPPGVIQYAFTYYNKYGQESNIFYTTPLQYISYTDRGGSPDDKVANSFRITISNVDRMSFEYLRIYSILRTSKDSVPLVKRVQDIKVGGMDNNEVTFVDNGLQGETVDPTELLYKGGDEVRVKTMEQKDGTLFLGNIKVTRPQLNFNIEVGEGDTKSELSLKAFLLKSNQVSKSSPLANDNITAEAVERKYKTASKEPFLYINTLDSSDKEYNGAACFKSREYYRLGVQFQYKNGKWSEPCWIGDKQCNIVPIVENSNGSKKISVPEFRYTLKQMFGNDNVELFKTLYAKGYRKVRSLFAVPGTQDRTILCQGIGAPAMYRKKDRNEKTLYGMASWLFRTNIPNPLPSNNWNIDGGGYVSPSGKLKSQYDIPFITGRIAATLQISPYLSSTEIMGEFTDEESFYIDTSLITLNSPDIEFSDVLAHTDFKGCTLNTVGYTTFRSTYGDISIQTSTPAIGSDAGGFAHKSICTSGDAALISGLYYNDYIVDDYGDSESPKYGTYHTSSPPVDFPVYMWHKNGSLNNDVARSGRSAELLKKKISNYRLGSNTVYASIGEETSLPVEDTQLFSGDQLSVIKVNGNTYQGNVNTMVVPSEPSPYYFAGNPWRKENEGSEEVCNYRLALKDPNNTDSRSGIWSIQKKGDNTYDWLPAKGGDNKDIGDIVKGLDQWREGVSIKYKSTPHLVVQLKSGWDVYSWGESGSLSARQAPIIEVCREYDSNTFYGGTSDEALEAATWIPCGPAVSFNADTESLELEFKWGDTYFQRFECLKTYPFTQEDKNQVIEIASFMVETRVNIDGRYDRNRAQVSNLNMTPQNFNLINPVYTQMDNFFSYKMLSEESYKNTLFPNTVTWTKTKQNGADVDLWTNITMANVLEMDGDKGEINKLIRLNNQLICFQDSGISQILYNENTQISTTEGVPIEIANSEKVQGKRYLSDTVGCSNKWSVVQTPLGIYFMDSNDKGIYLFNGQLSNLSMTGGFNSWAKQNIPSADVEWTPGEFNSFVAYYDKLNHDVLFINKDTALAYSEKFGCFTSFYDYGGAPYFNSLDDMGIWTKGDDLYQHQAGEYCNFFDTHKPFSMTLVGNQEPQMDKIFTNMEFRACVSEEGEYDKSKDKFVPALPFDTIEVWNEYQHGLLALTNRNSGDKHNHSHEEGRTFLNRKFRMWRCDIPRDNAPVDNEAEAPRGIKRFKARPLDRIRNSWVYIKLKKNEAIGKVEIHDLMATYFG